LYLDLFCLSATATVVSCNLYSNVISQRDETPPIDHIYIKKHEIFVVSRCDTTPPIDPDYIKKTNEF